MSHNQANLYNLDSHIAEIYDKSEVSTDDVQLIRQLIGERKSLRILEPFCGTGRILIPLVCEGHTLVGIDQAGGMLNRCAQKSSQLPESVRQRITLLQADAVKDEWSSGFDLVLLGGNCFYELATSGEQEGVIRSTARALKPGGHVYIDNDHMEGELDPSWQRSGVVKSFPSGTCADGTRLESTTEAIWFDVSRRLVRFRRYTRVTLPDGRVMEHEVIQQKHPVSKVEVQSWLEAHGFVVEYIFGDRLGHPYNDNSDRAIFWARRYKMG